MNKKIAIISASMAGLVMPLVAFAATVDPATAWITTALDNFLVKILWPIFAGLVIIMFIWAGFMYLTANGDPAKVALANRAIIYGVIGIVVAVMGFSAVNLIKTLVPSTGACTITNLGQGTTCYQATSATCSTNGGTFGGLGSVCP